MHRAVIFFICALFISACSSVPNIPIQLSVLSTKDLNSTDKSHPLPVQVRIYELSDLNTFNEASFRELWKHDKQILADSLILKKELTLVPNSIKRLSLVRRDDAEHIAIVTIFRNLKGAKWRAHKPIPSKVRRLFSQLHVRINANQVKII